MFRCKQFALPKEDSKRRGKEGDIIGITCSLNIVVASMAADTKSSQLLQKLIQVDCKEYGDNLA